MDTRCRRSKLDLRRCRRERLRRGPSVLLCGVALTAISGASTAQAATGGGEPVGLSMRAAMRSTTAPPVDSSTITPQSAADARAPVQAETTAMRDAGDHVAAANRLMAEAERLKDPVLYLDAADAFLAVAESAADLQWLDGAQQMAAVALDMLYYLEAHGGSARWTPLGPAELDAAIQRAEAHAAAAEAARARIEAALAGEDEETDEGTGEADGPRPARGMFIAGASLTGLGVLGAGAAAAGMAIGAAAQRDVTDPLVYRAEHEAAESRGRAGNIIAYAGGGLAVVGLGAGVALMIIAKKRERDGGAASEEDEGDMTADRPNVKIIPGGRGLTIKGSF